MNNLKLSAKAGLAALLLAGFGSSFAGTATGSFNVTMTLTSACQIRGAAPTADLGAYTAFAAPKTATALISFRCTRGLGGTPTITTPDSIGSVAGVNYAIAMGATSLQANQTGDAGVTGSYDVYSATVTVDTQTPQAGNAAAGTSTSHNVTITF